MIEVRGVTKRYGDKVAVRDLTFTVRPGIVTGFLGPNGAGKSTTMRMIAGLDAPTEGSVSVNGGTYAHTKAPMAELGILLEAKAVHTSRSAFNHLLAMAQTNAVPRSRVDEVIDQVGLSEVANKRAGVSPWAWANVSVSPRPCWATPAPSSWTSPSTASTRRASSGSATCSSSWPPKVAPCSSPRT